MRKFVRSASYLRVRAMTGLLFAVCGGAIVVQGYTQVHSAGWRAITIFVMGGALIALGVMRIRDYLRWRAAQ